MREDEDQDQHEDAGEEPGWSNSRRDDDGESEGEEGFMRDAGMVGLLQQVMKR
jgi:hypothetical protein